ncbi:MAG TPA: polyphenol oxidase family protein [Acidimicrobiales bacterium]
MSHRLNLVAERRGDLPVLALDQLRDLGVDAVVTTRRGGVSVAPYDELNLAVHVGDDASNVKENRRRLCVAMGVRTSALVIAHQVHGSVIHDVDQWEGGAVTGDALVSSRDDLALCVLVADCVPLLFVDPHGPRFAVAHAGWRGLVEGVIAATVAHFASPGELRVAIGPRISPTRYQVGPEVAALFASVPGALRDDEGDRSRLDLGVVALEYVLASGVSAANVLVCDESTDDVSTFFSDRAARPSGRFGLVARRSPYDSRVIGAS